MKWNKRFLKFLSDGESSPLHGNGASDGPRSDRQTSSEGDAELLDAYSQAVVNVVDTVSPSVISLTGQGQGAGSGFLISSEGLAITNSHVVQGRDRMIAMLPEGDLIETRVVGDDPATDLAVLELRASDLPHATVGDSTNLRVGQLVIAMGSPLGLQATISTGVVSALGRSMRATDGRLIESIVQHAAPINPGNSGGPLVDSRGRVIGVNTAIISMTQGIGFAVPSNTVQWVVDEVLEHGQVRRRQLGITATAQRLPQAVVRKLDLWSQNAVEVIDVMPDGLACRSGFMTGDIIVAINDRLTHSIDEIHRILALAPNDTTLEVTVIRDYATRNLDVAL